MKTGKPGFDTILQHGGYRPEENGGHLNEPIYIGAAAKMPNCEEAARRFSGESDGLTYARAGNETALIFERRMAELEGGEAALSFASGMAAIQCLILKKVQPGECVISQRQLYGGTSFFLSQKLPTLGREAIFVFDLHDEGCWRRAIEENRRRAKLIYVEMPANPTINLVDLKMITDLAAEYGIPVAVDSTFATSALLKPLEWGATYVIHSVTKYMTLGGTNLAGVIVGPAAEMKNLRIDDYMIAGAPLSAFDAWLCLMGLRTLSLRVVKQSDSADKLARWLSRLPEIRRVYYPTVADPLTKRLAKQYLPKGCGGVLALEYNGTKEDCVRFIEKLKIFSLAPNLGDTRSLVIHPASTTHSKLNSEQLKLAGISDTLVRLSVGLEDYRDLQNDLNQAL